LLQEEKAIYPFCVSYTVTYDKPKSGYCVSLEGTKHTLDYAASTFYTVNESNEYNKGSEDYKVTYKYDYYA
jgi:hypothetical protein